ncbi:hypothetical protein Gohar_021217, partial [Gossypium harknessii]|nr:hypothetical protein [Gossypium harknessii]
LGHVDEVVTDLFNRLDKRVTPIPTILAKTFRSLNKVDKVSYRVFSESYSPLKELAATLRRDDITEERWITILQNLQDEDIEWRATWLVPDEILYRCRNFDWVPLLGTWGAVRYAPLLVLRQYRSRQFITITQGLAQGEFSYKGDNYKKKIREIKRVNDNILGPSQEDVRLMEEYLQVVPSEIEIIKQDFEKKNSELGKRVEQLEEEKMHWKLDVDKKFQETQKRNEALEKSLLESRNEKGKLKARVAELKNSLHHYRNRNSTMELRTSLSKIEEMKRRVEKLEVALQNCEMQIEFLEASEEQVADYLQTLVVKSDMLSVKYKLESDRGQELASLLRKIKVLSIRAKPTQAKTKDMDQRLERLEQFQREMQDQLQTQMQEQLVKIQQGLMDDNELEFFEYNEGSEAMSRNWGINIIYKEAIEGGTLLDICPYELRSELNNWTAEEI